jgi:SPP1 family predicted phage head-tail adaptor
MSIVRIRSSPGGVDQYGDPIPSTETRKVIAGAFVGPRESNDLSDAGRVGVIVGLSLFAPYDADIVKTDEIEVDGVRFTIDGEVGRWRHPLTGWEAGLTAALERVEG